jgi:hypothetical protein
MLRRSPVVVGEWNRAGEEPTEEAVQSRRGEMVVWAVVWGEEQNSGCISEL